MCGRYNVTDSAEIQTLMGEHGLTGIASSLQLNVPREGKGALVVEAAGKLQLKLVKKNDSSRHPRCRQIISSHVDSELSVTDTNLKILRRVPMSKKAPKPMASDAARRIQSDTAKQGDGTVGKDSFAARATRAAAKRANKQS